MYYIFVINGREDRAWILEEIKHQIQASNVRFDYETYVTRGVGDGTRFVKIYCDLHPQSEVCFVACGGSGTLNEVVSGMAGSAGKYLAFFACGATNDFIKCFPDRDFRSILKLIAGDPLKVDLIRVNDSYAINTVNIGFDAVVASTANLFIEKGYPVRRSYNLGILVALLRSRRNRIKVLADGKPMNRHKLLLCALCNGRWCGGDFLSAPDARPSDGLIDAVLLKPVWLVTLLRLMPLYRRGQHLAHRWARRHFVYTQCRSLKVTSRNLIDICLDGEVMSGHSFQIDLLPQEISFILPSLIAMKKRFEPIIDKCGEIIDYLMSSPDIPKDEALQFKIRLSIEEAVENVVRYAYEGGMGWIEVGTELDEEGVMLTILLRDAGVPFNPLEKPDPDVSLSVEDREIGGLGIFLCKKLMDHIEYKYEDGCNILTMTKRVA
ncbi:MAG: ATP-binding protein [Bacteroidales bacterium]|nr:ATP-binding protein [Bacteroidales bacterium]